MSTSSFALPIDVPWKLVAASPDMMDTTFCDDSYPPVLAGLLRGIYAFRAISGRPSCTTMRSENHLPQGNVLDHGISSQLRRKLANCPDMVSL